MKVRIRPHPEVFKGLGIKGIPYWYNTGVVEGHQGYRKVMMMLEPKKEILSPNEQKIYEPVTEVIDEKEKVPPSILEDKRLIVEEYDEETRPRRGQNKKEVN